MAMVRRGHLDYCWAVLLLAEWGLSQEVMMMRRAEYFVDPVFVPDFFFDIAEAADVVESLNSPLLPGQSYRASVLDEINPHAPTMAPMLVWRTSHLWNAKQRRFLLDLGDSISGLIVDAGTHEWSRYLPILREDPGTFLVCIEPTRTAFLELYRRLKVDYADLQSRVLLLPVALTREADVPWGFRSLHTNDFLQGECNSLLMPDHTHGHPCTAEGPSQLVPAMSLDALLGLLIDDLDAEFKIELKVDAQGADIDILESLRDKPRMLRKIRDVQIEVSERVYLGQPGRGEVLQRMFALGFFLRWDLKEVHDGGLHPVSLGCRLVTDNPLTEDCFFTHLDSRPYWRYLDRLFKMPFESLRVQVGLELSVSRQYAIYASRQYKNCDVPGGIVHYCLGEEVGDPLRGLVHTVQFVWQVKPGKLGTVVDAFSASWDILHAASWDKLHEAGCAYFLFTLLVEASCRGFPGLCGAVESEENSTGITQCNTEECRRFWQCTTLEECSRYFRERAPVPELVVTMPSGFTTLLRTAQRLSAPPCLPREWNLELVRPEGHPLPTVLTADGTVHLTVLGVDSSVCALEISVVALDASVQDTMAFHRKVWEANEWARPLEATDVRLPSNGDLWSFDCVFPWTSEDGRPVRVAANTVSISMLHEVEHHTAAPVLTIRCHLPATVIKDMQAGVDYPPPSSVTLVSSPRAEASSGMTELALDLLLRPFTRPRARVAVCSQQAWGFEGLEEMVPGHVEFWFRYHLEVLGVDEVYLYDLDGSFLELPYLWEMVRAGRVIYEPSLGHIPPLREIFDSFGYSTVTSHFAQAAVQHHCWQQARHNADWVISIPHGWDMILYSPSGQSLQDLLSQLEPAGITYVDGVRYGSPPDDHPHSKPAQGHPNAFMRFPFHLDPEVRIETYPVPEEHIVIARPQLVEGVSLSVLAPRLEAPLFSHLLGDHWLQNNPSASPISGGALMNRSRHLNVHNWRANHYVHLFSKRAVYLVEEDYPQMKNFSYFDEHAAKIGEQLSRASGL